MSLYSCEARDAREVFISYRALDDEPPPGRPDNRGFVRYLLRQVRYDLRQLGVPDTILWLDRAQIAKGEDWSEAISSALNKAELFIAILSKNYITSSWCELELSTMASRVETLGATGGRRRIFRVDKHKVPEDDIPRALRRIQTVRFYSEDDETKRIDEYFWRGKVRCSREYEAAVRELALAICERLDELGIPREPQPQLQSQPWLRGYNARLSDGRVVFVAKPASDMVESYRTLVCELRGTGFRVTPDPDKDLGNLGEGVRSAVVNALAEAEASIHLLGQRTGGRPDGLDMDLVPMQLAAAADEAKRKPGFVRLIWAPTVLPPRTFAEVEIARRDPLSIVDRFCGRLPTDQIDGDTASRFNEFVLQRLERLGRKHSNLNHKQDPGTLQQAADANAEFLEPASKGQSAELVGGGDGLRYNLQAIANAIAAAKGESDPAPYFAKMEWRVDSKGQRVQPNAKGEFPKGAISYAAYAMRNAKVKAEYDRTKGSSPKLSVL
jgi:TIR domain